MSPDADRLVPLLPPAVAAANARDGRAVFLNGRPYGLPDTVRVATAATTGGGTVIAAVAYNQVGESLATLTRALLIGTPLLLALLAGASWLIAGSTLRPVTELRRGAQDVTRTGRPRALPVPEARDEVRNLALTLNDMLSRLGAAQERQRGLVSDTAHELRSPIASIRAQLEVALDHPDGAGLAADRQRRARGHAAAVPAGRGPAGAGPAGRAGHPAPAAAPGGPDRAGAGGGRPVRRGPGPGPAGRRRARGGDRGSRRAAPDAQQPDRQRHPLRAVPGRGLGGHGRQECPALGHRRRPRHPGRGPGAGLRPVHPAGGGAQPGGRRRGGRRAGAGHRAGHRPGPRRVSLAGGRRPGAAGGGAAARGGQRAPGQRPAPTKPAPPTKPPKAAAQ